jgi:DNA-binding NarL/FixJ family response regulator
MKGKSILIADYHTLFRKTLAMSLRSLLAIQVIREASNGEEVIGICDAEKIDLVLLEISIPGMNGVETASRLLKMRAPTRPSVIVLTAYDEPDLIYTIMQMGVNGYLNKNCEWEDLESTIRKVLDGHLVYPEKYDERLKQLINKNLHIPLHLQHPDKKLIGLIAEGKTNKEIAQVLEFSVRTIESKRIRLEKRFRVKNAAELISKAYQFGILSVSNNK